MSLATPEKIRKLQRKLYLKAKQERGGGTRCNREARVGFPTRLYSASWACCACAGCSWGRGLRER